MDIFHERMLLGDHEKKPFAPKRPWMSIWRFHPQARPFYKAVLPGKTEAIDSTLCKLLLIPYTSLYLGLLTLHTIINHHFRGFFELSCLSTNFLNMYFCFNRLFRWQFPSQDPGYVVDGPIWSHFRIIGITVKDHNPVRRLGTFNEGCKRVQNWRL